MDQSINTHTHIWDTYEKPGSRPISGLLYCVGKDTVVTEVILVEFLLFMSMLSLRPTLVRVSCW